MGTYRRALDRVLNAGPDIERVLTVPMTSTPSSSGSPTPTASEVKGELKEATKEATKSTLDSLRSFASGGIGGVCAVVVGHPFDLVKVRLQTAEKGVYAGAIDVVKRTVAREGLARVC